MPSNVSRRLVIDACVARAAGGEDAKHPVSRDCRDFLHVMLELPHEIVRTEDIWVEWRKHKSTYAKVWLNTMIAKKRVCLVAVTADEKLRNHATSAPIENEAAAMLKDCHLVEAACATDRIVVSKEVVARKLFARACDSVGWLKTIAWVNPAEQAEKPIDWMKNGAAPEEARCLVNFAI